MPNKYGDRGFWRFVPTVGRPFNPAYHSVWGLMTRREKQVSFLFDCAVVFGCALIFWLAK